MVITSLCKTSALSALCYIGICILSACDVFCLQVACRNGLDLFPYQLIHIHTVSHTPGACGNRALARTGHMAALALRMACVCRLDTSVKHALDFLLGAKHIWVKCNEDLAAASTCLLYTSRCV